MTKDLKLKGIVDMTLTPENAHRRGYRYVDDVLYDVFTLTDSINDIFNWPKQMVTSLAFLHLIAISIFFTVFMHLKQLIKF